MINRGATLISRMAVLFAVLFTFTACGGGGGGGDTFFQGDNTELKLTLYDPQGIETKTVTTSSPGTVRVKVKDNGSNVVVSATTTIGTLFPASGTALTNGSGIATFQLEAGAEKGAGTITATATTQDGALTGTLGFQIGESGLRLGYFDDNGAFIENQIMIEPQTTLSAGGNAQLSVVVLTSGGERVTTAEEVRFNSGCIAAGQATINPANPKSANGVASTLYTAAGCSGNDNVTASLVGASAQAFGTVSIASPQANAVNFISATPQLIVLRGTGGGSRDETSDVIFKVVDGTGAPLQGTLVNFSLSTEVGGLSLSKTSALSDGEGQVTVTVSSGDIATTVRVIATVNSGGETVATASDLLTVTTGLPDQNSISLAVADSFIVENGMTTDGLTRTLTVSMADKFNNPVIDGTAAVFTTEYGAIVGSCTTVDGTCSVEWRSQAPRYPTLTGSTYVVSADNDAGIRCPSHSGPPIPCYEDLGYTRGGRSTILVHAIGEESFIDSNGNGVMDEAEKDQFENLPEAFLDNNEDGYYTPALPTCIANPNSKQCIAGQEETFIDFNNNQVYDLNDDPAVYNGLLCPPEGDGVWCSRDLVNVRAENIVILSNPYGAGFATILVNGSTIVQSVTSGTGYTAYISDAFNTQPPAGSTITVSTDGDCELTSQGSFTVQNNAKRGAFAIDVRAIEGDIFEAGTLTITLDPTGGAPYAETYSCGRFVNCNEIPTPSECTPP
ncbi:MAG: hypothetical protein R3E64_08125 [Halioglobus sp.]